MVQRSTLVRDDGNWIKMTFNATVGVPFEKYSEALEWSSKDNLFGAEGSSEVHAQIKELINGDASDQDSPTPIYFTKKKCRDTTLGGNDAINPYYQYCENDDISQPMTMPNYLGNPDPAQSGMGRVYSENIDDNQQILYLSFGVAEYNSVTGFFSDVILPDLASWMNSGSRFTPSKLAGLLGSVVGTFILLPVLPLIFIYKAVKRLSAVPISKYYDLRTEMPMYYRFVNSIIISLAVNMGLSNNARVLARDASAITGSKTNPSEAFQSLFERIGLESGAYGDGGLPEIFTSAGWDIYRIMLRRYRYEDAFKSFSKVEFSTDNAIQPGEGSTRWTDNVIPAWDAPTGADAPAKTWADDMLDGFQTGLQDANLFVGFRVEKSVDTSESFSNATGPSPVAAAINARHDHMASIKHTLMGGNITGGPVGNVIEEVFASVKNFVVGAADQIGFGGASQLILGTGRVDIPDIWTDSQFSKNYSFNMALRSPYGDPVSIFSSIYVPMALILAGCLPRAVGANAYTSPFLCRAYIKGMLGIPLGIIDSVNIKRGSDQHGWNAARMPTSVDISFTIKDLSPAMYMSMSDTNGIWDMLMGSNSTFQEYLQTLGGLGLSERLNYLHKLTRKSEILARTFYKNRLNPIAWGMGATTSTALGRAISAVAPKTGLPSQ